MGVIRAQLNSVKEDVLRSSIGVPTRNDTLVTMGGVFTLSGKLPLIFR
jgi:hypothetical protein